MFTADGSLLEAQMIRMAGEREEQTLDSLRERSFAGRGGSQDEKKATGGLRVGDLRLG